MSHQCRSSHALILQRNYLRNNLAIYNENYETTPRLYLIPGFREKKQRSFCRKLLQILNFCTAVGSSCYNHPTIIWQICTCFFLAYVFFVITTCSILKRFVFLLKKTFPSWWFLNGVFLSIFVAILPQTFVKILGDQN